jgi:hypothetical protein
MQPWGLNRGQHGVQLFQRIMIDAIAGARPFNLTLNQPRDLQYLEMLADRGLSQRQHLNQLAANALVDGFQMGQNLNPRRVGQRLAYFRQTVCIQWDFFKGWTWTAFLDRLWQNTASIINR